MSELVNLALEIRIFFGGDLPGFKSLVNVMFLIFCHDPHL